MGSAFGTQVAAIIYRRIIIHKRSGGQLTRSIIMTVLSSLAALTMQLTVKRNDKLKTNPISFAPLKNPYQMIAVVTDPSIKDHVFVNEFINNTCDLIYNETKIEPDIMEFNSTRGFEDWVYNSTNSSIYMKQEKFVLLFAFEIRYENPGYNIIVYHNNSLAHSTQSIQNIERILYKSYAGDPSANFDVTYVELIAHKTGNFVSQSVPVLVTFGIMNIGIMFISQVIEDISSERRPFMILCGMSTFVYWIGCFVADLLVWIFVTSSVWGIYVLSETTIFSENKLTSWLILQVAGPGTILIIYCLSFIFNSPDTGTNYAYFCLMLPFIILSSSAAITDNDVINQAFALFQLAYPVTNLFVNLTFLSQGQFKMLSLAVPMIASLVLSGVLAFIEYHHNVSEETSARNSFSQVKSRFWRQRRKFAAAGARDMDKRVKENEEDYLLRCVDVCRMFKGAHRETIAAVNHVTIGAVKGETFGLLGANGAGKTTLMKMIFGRLATSYGSIKLNGRSVKPGAIAFCPQFDDHLTPELTGIENFRFFSMLFGIPSKKFEKLVPDIVEALDLKESANLMMGQMSGGNARKVSIGVSFLSNSPLVMLDEPTASLDPVARRKVHQLIMRFKGKKTFVLCTHLLNEAEALCDNIAIMVRGCVYTAGSPQFLASTWGRDWKVDVLLQDPSCAQAVDRFMSETVPGMQLQFERHRTRIYSVLCGNISLTDLFDVVQRGKEENIGIEYFTCSSSTLEKVFMELVKMTELEQAGLEQADDSNPPPSGTSLGVPVDNTPDPIIKAEESEANTEGDSAELQNADDATV